MKRIARWSTIFLLLCSIIWAGTASAAMIVENNMGALNTLNTINKNQTPQGKDSALERLAKEIGAGIWDNTDWDDPAFQENIGRFGITVLKKDTQPPESFIGDAIFDHLGDTEFNAPEMNGNLLVLGGLNANLPSGKIDRLYVLSDEDVRLNIGAAAEVQELILGASGNVSLNGEGNVRSTIVVDKPMNLDIGIATNLVNLTDAPLPTGDIVLNPGKNALVPGQQLHMGSELKVEKKISLTVRFRLVDQSAKDMQLEAADWDGALLTEATVQYTGDSCPMGAVNMMDSIEAAFAEKYPDLQEQYVLLPEMRSADPWSKVYRLNGGESCFAVTENYVYLSREGDVAFPLTDDSTLVAEFPVYVYRYGEQDGRITYRVRISGARPDYFTPSLTLRSGAVASFTFDKERGEWVTQFKRSDFGADERALIHLTGLRGEETDTFLPVTGREERRIVTLTWTADTQRVTIDAQNVLWGSDMPAEGNDLLCRAGEQVTVQIAPAAGYRGIHVFLSDPAISLSISEGNDAVSFLMPYAPLTLTLTADKLYTVTMDTAGGDPIRPIQYTVESEAFQLPTPVRTGYIFLGWTGEGITEPQKTIEIPQGSTGDRTYTANWQVIEYTIITLLEGGNAGSSQVYFYTVEQTVTLPTPTRTGYTFLGWTGEGITTPQPNVTIPKGSTGDKRYIENWELTEYNITMDLNGGSGQEKVVYTMTDEDFELPTPTRNGYEFVGWMGEGITTPQTSVKIPKGSTGDKAYTANWQVIEYTITLDTNGGPVVSPIKYTVEDTFTLPYILRPGYEFAGWTLDGSGMLPSTPLIIYPGTTGDLHYKAEWRLAEYTITMDLNGGSGQEKVVYTITDEDFELPTPTRNGYEFVGWTGERITTPQTSVKIPKGSTGNKAYTANWQVIKYTIITLLEGGNAGSSGAYVYTVEETFTLPTPTRTGYTFWGWTGEGITKPQPSVTIPRGSTGDKTYIENWVETGYTITLDLNGGSGKEKVIYTMTDEDFELPTPTRNGYEFVGWTGERITTPQTSVKIPKGSTGNKAYTANWKVIRYTITLVTNGGAVIASIRYTVEDSVTLPIPPERPGYEFAGWVLDGSGQFPSTPMIIPEGSTGDRIYEAEWRVATYTITYVSHGKAYNWVQYTINNSVYFSVPEEDTSYYLPGYTFVGWKIDGVSGTPRSYMLPKGSYGNRTATMLWEPIP
ncbi:MAG: InlB B-repeat-containing protein [Christensenellales bacterium]|nr:InlB B-repeat-containing protein [Christensenellales bacterium]